MTTKTKTNPDREAIARLMADGRERTVNDVALSIGRGQAATYHQLKSMVAMGLLRSHYHNGAGLNVFRAKSETNGQ